MDKIFGKKPTMKGNYFNCRSICVLFLSYLTSTYAIYIYPTKYNVSEQAREGERAIRKQTREVERDRRGLEREEAKLEADIKKAAKAGNKQACTVLAKQLVQLRKQKTRTYTATSQVNILM